MKLLPDVFASRITDVFRRQAEEAELECRELILSLVEKTPNANLLDVGCADAEFTVAVAERIGTKRICGVDVVEDNIVKAKARGIEVYQADLNQRLVFEDASFDVVLASHVIEHLWNTDVFMREVYRVLKKAGYAIVATPNLAAFHNILYLIFAKQPPTVEVSDETLVGTWSTRGDRVDRTGPAHRRVFTMGALEGLLRYYGFKVERSLGSGFLPCPKRLGRVMCSIDKKHATNITVKARKVEPDKHGRW